VVLLSVDGAAAATHRRLVAERRYREQTGFVAFERSGLVVDRALPPNPTLTAVSHATISCGALPERTGIVSNRFHLPGQPITKTVSGFDAPYSAETLWQALRRQGKRVGVLTFPGHDAKSPERTADFGIVWADRAFAPAELVTLPREAFAPLVAAATPSGEAPPRRAELAVALKGERAPVEARFLLTAIDTQADGRAAYDTVLVDDDTDATNGLLGRARLGEWFPLRVTMLYRDGGPRVVGAWCFIQAFPSDLAELRLYRGAFNATEAYPRDFRQRLDATAGFWPSAADDDALAAGLAGRAGIDLEHYLDQMRRFTEYFSACAGVAIASEPFDLLMLYQPVVDETAHALLLIDPRQAGYNPAAVKQSEWAIAESFLAIDRAVAELAGQLDLERDALVVVSDHGMAPIWEEVRVNQLLLQAGLLWSEESERGYRIAQRSLIVAHASGGCAHLYVNLQGRETDGVVAADRVDDVITQASAFLARAEVDGVPVVDTMVRRDQLGGFGLANEASGDLVVFLKPGFAASSAVGARDWPSHEPARYRGQHGFLNTHDEVASIWLARGAGVTPARVPRAPLTEVAPYVARLIGVERPH
jgi:predicted AlkP superfamily phosphohydrolase/phosphomutase